MDMDAIAKSPPPASIPMPAFPQEGFDPTRPPAEAFAPGIDILLKQIQAACQPPFSTTIQRSMDFTQAVPPQGVDDLLRHVEVECGNFKATFNAFESSISCLCEQCLKSTGVQLFVCIDLRVGAVTIHHGGPQICILFWVQVVIWMAKRVLCSWRLHLHHMCTPEGGGTTLGAHQASFIRYPSTPYTP